MDNQIDDINLLDLISDKYFKLRKINEQMWNNTHPISITNSEWFIISAIYGKLPTISEITQRVNKSRQATHKSIKMLNSKGFLVINNVENNCRDKCLKLTPLGETCYLEYKRLKETIERDVATILGSEKVIELKNLLEMEWN